MRLVRESQPCPCWLRKINIDGSRLPFRESGTCGSEINLALGLRTVPERRRQALALTALASLLQPGVFLGTEGA
jgi:hypothetical protein